MKRLSLAVFASLLTLSAVAQNSTSFGVLVDNLDLRKNTKLHVREYWKSIQNQEVSWSGEAYDVQAKGSQVKLLVADKSRPLYRGYNIVVNTTDVEKAANIKKGQHVRFTGTLSNYKPQRAGAVIELAGAQLQ